jgi:hypothetical protein
MAQSSQPQFKHALTYALDQIIPGTGPGDFSQLDANQTFLREVMCFDDAKIKAFRDSTEAFFRDTFGLDFTGVPADKNNIKNIPGVSMMPFRFTPAAEMSVLFHSNVGHLSERNRVRDGGYFAMIMGPGVSYRGTYGGAAGKPASPGEFVVAGFYNIVNLKKHSDDPDPSSSPIIINYQALGPVRTTADGDMVLHCGLQHPAWGEGVGRGVQVIAPSDSSHLKVMQRSVLTFPPSLV